MLNITDDIKNIKGIGNVSAARFNRLGIETVGNMLCHYPFRYETYALPIAIAHVIPGRVLSVEGVIISSPRLIYGGKAKIVEVKIKDDTGELTVKWFNAVFMMKTLKVGNRLIFRGQVSEKSGRIFMSQPEVFTRDKYRLMLKNLKPVYRSVNGLKQSVIRKAMEEALREVKLPDYMPAGIKRRYGLPGLFDAIESIHFPKNDETAGIALRRMVFDEFFMFMANMRLLTDEETRPNINPVIRTEETDEFIGTLGFELTPDQKKAIDEIFSDLSGEGLMQRLLQGDVGSGKTAVALIALFATVKAGYQGCIMAPTEVLASQHYAYFKKMLSPYGIKTVYLAGNLTASAKKEARRMIKEGEADVIVGTHAAVFKDVEYKNPALAVIDEQHRFGVRQREALELKGDGVHLLLMSATPIPRTYALMLYGNMAISVIKELPAGRKPIKNLVGDENMRPRIYKFIRNEIDKGHQAYVICHLIEESENSDLGSVEEFTGYLKTQLPGVRIDSLNGRMKSAEKDEIMNRFKNHETDLLISTTVIEVGINVPNATVMMIENADYFGLAQLHQIRGRVGRGADESYCIFMCDDPSDTAKERLDIIAHSNDGFFIAEKDMKLRGPGDFFGVRQSGERQFVLADPLRDGEIMVAAKEAVSELSETELETILNARKLLDSNAGIMVY